MTQIAPSLNNALFMPLFILQQPESFPDKSQIFLQLLPTLSAFYLFVITINLIVLSYYRARQRAYVFANSEIDGVRFYSGLGARRYFWVIFTNLILVVSTLGLAYPWTKVRMARLLAENTEVDSVERIDRYLSQTHDAESSLGYQLGEAFDVDLGVGF